MRMEATLASVRQHLRRPLESEFARGQLTGPQRSVMSVVVSVPTPLSLREIVAKVGLAQSTVSGIVDRLVQSGFLVKSVDTRDARVTSIAASQEVRTFLEKRAPELTLSPLLKALKKATVAQRKRILAALLLLDELLGSEGSK
jgi:DNA-binding MarR family transcriptional regulator